MEQVRSKAEGCRAFSSQFEAQDADNVGLARLFAAPRESEPGTFRTCRYVSRRSVLRLEQTPRGSRRLPILTRNDIALHCRPLHQVGHSSAHDESFRAENGAQMSLTAGDSFLIVVRMWRRRSVRSK